MKVLNKLAIGLFLSFWIGNALALDAIYTPLYSNLAINGYDAVAYFSENAAIKGSKSHQFEWQGATWQFASAENNSLFASNPEKYAPQYGGYCAWAAAQNDIAATDPEQFTIVDGKLYLNYDSEVQQKWLKQKEELIKLGDQYWPGLLTTR